MSRLFALNLIAGTGFEPVSTGYEPVKEPLLYPAILNSVSMRSPERRYFSSLVKNKRVLTPWRRRVTTNNKFIKDVIFFYLYNNYIIKFFKNQSTSIRSKINCILFGTFIPVTYTIIFFTSSS